MYTIYVGDKPIILTTEIKPETDFQNFLLKTVNIGKVIKLLNETDLKGVYLIDKKQSKLLKRFLKLLPNVEAGGGKVYNKKKDILFIYRNNKWDLPKGKTEKKESIEDTAIREVEEETGVKGLKIKKPLPVTYHIFKRSGKHQIKITYWYEMQTSYSGKLKPEQGEGITKAKWLDSSDTESALNNSYANIRQLF